MDTNKMREEFEAAFIAQQVAAYGEYSRGGAVHRLKRDGEFDKPPTAYDLQRREQGMYDEYWIEMLWWAWQASREAVVVELQEPDLPEAYIDEPVDRESEEFRYLEARHGAQHQTYRKCRQAIEAQGLNVEVKP
ncbi:hypothetical protein I5S84_11320 [Pseudomonas putida]|uniref:hypothetical protein n=1 Tax=Pseudomonas putida TaxID=303 RepID=UPI0018D90D99|nr:hypothetical protein [Pseudomonas putida]MBH3449441.1 hypothetical protein [Pseudomonas putida]